MKRLISLFLAMMMAFALVSCGKTAEPAAPDASEIAEVANPIHEVTAEEMTQQTGIALAIPSNADDVVYTVIDMENEEPIAEASFTYQGVPYYLRAQSTGELEPYDMSGLNYNWKSNSEGDLIRERPSFSNTCDEAGFIAWLDVVPGINYNLCTTQGTDWKTLETMALLVFPEE